MAFVDRNSRHILNRILMFWTDIHVLLRRQNRANLVETIGQIIRQRR